MNPEIMKQAGFGEEVKLVNQGYCPFCHKKVNTLDFRDALSIREFEISGICQSCQNETFRQKEYDVIP